MEISLRLFQSVYLHQFFHAPLFHVLISEIDFIRLHHFTSVLKSLVNEKPNQTYLKFPSTLNQR